MSSVMPPIGVSRPGIGGMFYGASWLLSCVRAQLRGCAGCTPPIEIRSMMLPIPIVRPAPPRVPDRRRRSRHHRGHATGPHPTAASTPPRYRRAPPGCARRRVPRSLARCVAVRGHCSSGSAPSLLRHGCRSLARRRKARPTRSSRSCRGRQRSSQPVVPQPRVPQPTRPCPSNRPGRHQQAQGVVVEPLQARNFAAYAVLE
jgi:hypothetical protein